jgi:hypothetical protein
VNFQCQFHGSAKIQFVISLIDHEMTFPSLILYSDFCLGIENS